MDRKFRARGGRAFLRLWTLAAGLAATAVTATAAAAASETAPDFDVRVRALAQSKRWLRLLHYKRDIPFGLKRGFRAGSRIDGQDFFLAPTGDSDPEAELRATIAALREGRLVGERARPAVCSFPERAELVRKSLGLEIPKAACPDLDAFLARFSAKKVHLVFSSAYPNNPGSMFGHAFLRFESGSRPDFLDYSVNYAAYVGTDAGVMYMARGVFGGYPGVYGMSPYYERVNEYSNSESRDILEYRLALGEDEALSLLRHLWEVETNSRTRYYFFDENCASAMLDAIETTRDDLDLERSSLFVAPGEAVRAVAQAGLVESVRFRPSLSRRLGRAYRELPSERRQLFLAALDGKASPDSIDDAATLDALNLYHQYAKQRAGDAFKEDQKTIARAFLVRRSQVPAAAPSAPSSSEADGARLRPDRAHRPQRAYLGAGRLGEEGFAELGFRFALHDLLDDDEGYPAFSQIEMLSFVFRKYERSGGLDLERLTLASVTSLFPLSRIERRPSWRFDVGLRRPKDYGCASCSVAYAEAGAGATIPVVRDRWLATAMASVEAETAIDGSSGLRLGYRAVPVFGLGLVADEGYGLKSVLQVDAMWDAFQYEAPMAAARVRAGQSWSFAKNWRASADFAWRRPARSEAPEVREGSLALGFYF